VRLDVASVLLEWGTGGLLGCWVTTRHRVVGIGYGWLLRAVFVTMLLGAAAAGLASPDGGSGAMLRNAGAIAAATLGSVALVTSVVRRGAGLRGEGTFDPRLDLLAPIAGLVALFGAADAVGGPYALSAARLVAGALVLGAVSDAMLLGHWYLVQPGLGREPIKELVRLGVPVVVLDVALLLVPTGMLSVLDGAIDDGYQGLLGWIWALSALSTLALLGVTWLALKERSYSAVMAATGLLYLAILTAFGTDVLARALLAS
jgi:hypothetical protein